MLLKVELEELEELQDTQFISFQRSLKMYKEIERKLYSVPKKQKI